jgi:hypothetical protein
MISPQAREEACLTTRQAISKTQQFSLENEIARLNDIVGQASSPESFRDPRNDAKALIRVN